MSYHVTAEWDEGGGWVLTCTTVPGAVSQCARLEQASGEMAEALTRVEGRDVIPEEITVSWHVPGAVGTAAERAAELRSRAEQIAAEVAAKTRQAVRELREAGLSYRDIGTVTGISYQRAHQLGAELAQGCAASLAVHGAKGAGGNAAARCAVRDSNPQPAG